MNEEYKGYKGFFIALFGLFLAVLLVALEYYKIAKLGSLGVLIGFTLGMYGFVIHMRIIYKDLFNKDDDSSKET
jgi:hypothetical protein